MKNNSVSTKYVDVLDGIRALSVIIILVFHFFQQTWIFPNLKLPFLSFAGITGIDFTPFARAGYLFVDMMILISGFLLFLPVARNVLTGEPLDGLKDFFRKRDARILPSYFLCIAVVFVYELINRGYGDPTDWTRAIKDLVLHCLFLHTWTVGSYLDSHLNTVLWTLGVEVWFYILFPFISSFIKRRRMDDSALSGILRALTAALVMTGISLIYIYLFVLKKDTAAVQSIDSVILSLNLGFTASYTAMVINQLPAYLGTYAVGILCAFLYTAAALYVKRRWWISLISTLLALFSIWVIIREVTALSHLPIEEAQFWQVRMRLPIAFLFSAFILFAAYSAKWFRFLFSNPLMKFLSAISYNLYIWHQWLSVKIKYDWRIPYWTGDTPPNQLYTPEGNLWSWKYAVVITIAAFAAAILVTYLFEKPAAKLILDKHKKKK